MNWECTNPIFLDTETQSASDLTTVGGKNYIEDSSTRLFILTWIHSGVGHCWIPDRVCPAYNLSTLKLPGKYRLPHATVYRGDSPPQCFFESIKHAPIIAHNADTFDRYVIQRFVTDKCIILDSIHACRAAGLPGGLDHLAQRLFGFGKHDGSALLKKLTSMNGRRYVVPNRMEIETFAMYAMADTALLAMIWDNLNVYIEDDIIQTNRSINERGIGFDQTFCLRLQRLANYSAMDATTRIRSLTGIDNPRSGPQMHKWLNSQGIEITDINGKPTLRKEVVEKIIHEEPDIYNYLSGTLTPLVVDVLELRSRVVRASTAKLETALARQSNGRLFDLHIYHQAHTGRFSSSGVQIHNLPRPDKRVKVKESCEVIETSSDTVSTFEKLSTINKADIGSVITSLIRSILIPRAGSVFGIVDYSAIEARGIAWIADESRLLQVFKDGKDPYKSFASKLFGILPDAVSEDQRQVGKIAVLGCGYGMGEQRMAGLAAQSKVDFKTAGTSAREVVEAYRDAFPKIAGRKVASQSGDRTFRIEGVWQWLDKASKAAVIDRSPFRAGKCTFFMEGNSLMCQLPSGRLLHYPLAAIEEVYPSYYRSMGIVGPPKASITYITAKGYRKALYGGILAENIVQGICRDLLTDALLRIEKAGFATVLHVHDEIVTELPIASAETDLKTIEAIMCQGPGWASGFPIAVEGFLSRRYSKKPI